MIPTKIIKMNIRCKKKMIINFKLTIKIRNKQTMIKQMMLLINQIVKEMFHFKMISKDQNKIQSEIHQQVLSRLVVFPQNRIKLQLHENLL